MFGAGDVGIRLSLDELLFLCAAMGADKVYGIKGNTRYSSKDLLNKKWNDVRNSLSDKAFARVEDETLYITSELAETMEALCFPKLFMVATIGRNGKDTIRNIYYAKKHAVCMYAEENTDNFFITRYRDMEMLNNEYISTFELGEREYAPHAFSAQIPEDEFKTYMEAVATGAQAALNLPDTYANDLNAAIAPDTHRVTIITRRMDGDDGEICDFLIYAASEYLWEIDITGSGSVAISTCSSEDFRRRIGHLAYLIRCF